MKKTTNCCLAASLSILVLHEATATTNNGSSFPSRARRRPHHRSSSSREQEKRRTRRRRRVAMTKTEGLTTTTTDDHPPHDVTSSSSSPSFLPLVFSDDDEEREEHILSALARLELEDIDEDVNEKKEDAIQKTRLKRTKRIVKEAMSSIKEEQKEKSRMKTEETKAVDEPTKDVEVKASSEGGVKAPPKETPAPTNPQLSFVRTNDVETSSRRQNLSQPSMERSAEYPPRPVWTRPRVPLQNRPPPVSQISPTKVTHTATSGNIPVAGTPRTVSSVYPYVSGTVTTPRSQANDVPRLSSAETQSSTTRWVRKFLSSRPKDTLLPIPREYLSDGFNLVQLAPIVERIGRLEGGGAYVPPAVPNTGESFPLFKAALRHILGNDADESTILPPVQRAAEVLYTLVHARYVISPRGLDTVRRVLRKPDGAFDPVFGRCPRIKCRGMPVLPCGNSDSYDQHHSVMSRAKRYCPSCGEKFYMWDSKVDESAWGSSFCNLFLMIYGSVVFQDFYKSRAIAVKGRSVTRAEQTIFGFKVHPMSQLRYSVADS